MMCYLKSNFALHIIKTDFGIAQCRHKEETESSRLSEANYYLPNIKHYIEIFIIYLFKIYILFTYSLNTLPIVCD